MQTPTALLLECSDALCDTSRQLIAASAKLITRANDMVALGSSCPQAPDEALPEDKENWP